MSFIGVILYSASMNLFIIPANTYSGGLMGLCQLIKVFLSNTFQINFGSFDFTGIVYYIINIPIGIWSYKSIGKKFFAKTIFSATALSFFMSIIPVPSTPILGEDVLASCIIGGIINGIGTGLTLTYGSSMGGLDIIGIILTAKKKASSIGSLYLVVNAIIYCICFFAFDAKTVIYSIILAAIASFSIDKVHTQNINVEVKVITKNRSKELQTEIMNALYRGVTRLECKGAYTEDDEYIFYILMSKYEVSKLREIVHRYDPNAFVVTNENVSVYGNFIKKM